MPWILTRVRDDVKLLDRTAGDVRNRPTARTGAPRRANMIAA
jgi:hypothetical protein